MCEVDSKACIASGGHLLWGNWLTRCVVTWHEGGAETVLGQVQRIMLAVLGQAEKEKEVQ